jgi:tetratricopeptide (TPR) repeat protein
MLVADRRQSPSTIPVSELSNYLTGANQQAFLKLRLALGLDLRRQLIVAVCDDLALRDAIAEKLAQDLPRLHDLNSFTTLELGLSGRLATPRTTDKLLTLTLNPTEPTILGPFFQELRRDPQRPRFGVQILGVEQLTRQPVHIQRAFLNHLRGMGRNFAHIDSNILLWVTRPWWRSIQQSAPEFWRWHNGIFEFDGDPLPAGSGLVQPAIVEKPIAPPASIPLPITPLPIVTTFPVEPIPSFVPSVELEPEPDPEPNFDLGLAAAALMLPDLMASELTEDAVPEPIVEAAPIVEEAPAPEIMADPIVLPDPAPIVSTNLDHLEPSPEELELADLVLASVMQQVSQDESALVVEGDTPNLEHPSFEPIRILQQVELLQQQQLGPEAFAAVYRQLGDYYRNHHDTTLSQNPQLAAHELQVGIRAYDVAWKFLPQTATSISAEIFNDIGNLYWMLSRTPGAADRSLEHLQSAIDRYQQALTRMDCATNPYTCAMLHNNVGAAYGDLALRQEPVDNLEKSIAAYESALRYRPAAAEPRRYAATQNNLGTAYWNLGQYHSLVKNLQRAVAAYNEALRIYNPEEEPLHYAMIQNNLGTAYWNLAQCDLDSDDPDECLDASADDLLRLAIGSYRIGLIYRTREIAPSAHAATQNNLGTAYWHLANQPSTHYEEVQGFLHQAIGSYETAIVTTQKEISTPLTFDIAATHNNLASAYYQAATNRHAHLDRTTQGSYLDLTLQHHLEALGIWGQESDLYDAALNGVMQSIRAIHELQGISGQTRALSKLPPTVLNVVMKAL